MNINGMIARNGTRMRGHRIFIAINLPEDVKSSLMRAAQVFDFVPARWVRVQGIHLTLVFVGYLDNDQLVELINQLELARLSVQPFQVSLSCLHLAPEPKRPRYLWIDVKAGAELTQLYEAINLVLAGNVPVKKDRYKFLPHITLARIADFRYRPEHGQPTETDINFTVPVNSFEVMESFLQKGGAQYQVVKSYSLGE